MGTMPPVVAYRQEEPGFFLLAVNDHDYQCPSSTNPYLKQAIRWTGAGRAYGKWQSNAVTPARHEAIQVAQ